MSDALMRLAELVHRETGIVIREPQLPALAAALGRAAPGVHPERFLGDVAGQLGGGAVIARLVDEVTIKETYFLREVRELQAVDWRALWERARAGGAETVRVWVSACATGEEAYSLAMLASEAFGSGHPPVSILASDISTAVLERADAAHYSARSLRNVSPELRERYFDRVGSHHAVRQSLRSLVRFRHHNLVNDPAPPPGEVAFDLIACRNVLIYFDGPTVERVIGSLESALRPEGLLVLGVADRLSGTAGRLARGTLGAAPPERRRPRAPRRELRRPLGLEGPGPSGSTGGPFPAAASGGPARGTGDPSDAAPRRRVEDQIETALEAADRGDLEAAIALSDQVLTREPLTADAYFVRGLAELGLGDAPAAVSSFRRALYLDPSFGLAAFQLGRAHDARGDPNAARRGYEQALRTLDPDDDRHRVILDQVDLADVMAACRARLETDGGRRTPPE
ncbi:MAG: hypothetical protein M3417_00170 [Actinomycetota bacterium]|nr:hypothetical protein [Actinomycetota bacterium]